MSEVRFSTPETSALGRMLTPERPAAVFCPLAAK